MYEYIDTTCRVYEDTDRQERNMFQLSRVPQPMEHWQDYIDLVKNNGDENAFLVFLHFYEPTINGKVESFVNRYGLHGHFADLKMAYVEALWERLREYPPDCKIPFLKYVKQATTDAMNSYAALNLKGFSISQDKQYYRLRTAAYIYKTTCLEDVEQALRSAPCDGENRQTAAGRGAGAGYFSLVRPAKRRKISGVSRHPVRPGCDGPAETLPAGACGPSEGNEKIYPCGIPQAGLPGPGYCVPAPGILQGLLPAVVLRELRGSGRHSPILHGRWCPQGLQAGAGEDAKAVGGVECAGIRPGEAD